MEYGAVVFDDTDEHRRLLREAAGTAVGEDADLLVLTFVTPEDIEEDLETLDSIGRAEGVDYSDRTLVEGLQQTVDEQVASVLDGRDVDYEVRVIELGTGESAADRILELGDSEGFDHVFLLGRRRSPTGKAVFGDTAQSVILNFEGFVTVATR